MKHSSQEPCSLCVYTHFDQNIFGNNSILDNCSPKINGFIVRNVLLVENASFYGNLSFFDKIYSEFTEAIAAEEKNLIQFASSNITFYISKGTHIIQNNTLFSNIFLFNRIKVNILIKALLCNEINIPLLCIENENKAFLVFDDFFFSFVISEMITIINVDFQGPPSQSIIDACKNFNISNYSQNFGSEIIYYGLFHLRAIFDDPFVTIPTINLLNVSFQYFHLVRSFYVPFTSLISIEYFGGNVALTNVTIENAYFDGSFINFNSSYSLQLSLYGFFNFSLYIQEYLSNTKNQTQIINIEELSIDSLECICCQSDGLNGFIFFSSYRGDIILENIIVSNSSWDPNKYFCSITAGIYTNYLNGLIFKNLTNVPIFNLQNLNFTNINDLRIENCTWYAKALALNLKEINLINISSLFFIGSSNYNVSVYFIICSNSQILINQSNFFELKGLLLYFTNSKVSWTNSNFNEINMNSLKINLKNTDLFIKNSTFSHIFGFQILFNFLTGNMFQIISCQILNFDGLYFLSGDFISLVVIRNSLFSNLTNFNYFFDKNLQFGLFTLENTSFSGLYLNYGLLYSTTSMKLLISSCIFQNISVTSSKSSYFINVQSGSETIQNSSFSSIFIFAGGKSLFSFQISDVSILNNQFTNCGFAYPINISLFSSIEYGELFFIWTCQNIFINNNTFINKGNISLFSGFLYCSLVVSTLNIQNNYFKNIDKNPNFQSTGLVLNNAPILIFNNNEFHGMECPNFSSFIHNNGAVSFVGDSSYTYKANKKNATLKNNSFFDCKCQKGGSLGIINYDYVFIDLLVISNSRSNLGGGLILISSSLSYLNRVICNHTSAYAADIFFLLNILNISLDKCRIFNAFGNNNGGILTTNVYSLNVSEMIACNITTFSSGGVFALKGFSSSFYNSFFLSCNAGFGGAIIYLTENGNISINNISVENGSSQLGGAIYISSSNSIEIMNCKFKRCFSFLQGAALYVNIIFSLAMNSSEILQCESAKNGIIFLNNYENSANYTFNNLTCKNNSAVAGSCIFFDGLGFLFIKVFSAFGNENSLFYLTVTTDMFANISQGFIGFGETNKYIIYANNIDLILFDVNFNQNTFGFALILLEFMKQTNLSNLVFNKNNAYFNASLPHLSCSNGILLINIVQFALDLSENGYFLNSLKCQVTLLNSSFSFQNSNAQALIIQEYGTLILDSMNFLHNKIQIFQISDCNVSVFKSLLFFNKKSDSSSGNDFTISSKFSSNIHISFQDSLFYSQFLSTSISFIQILNIENCSFDGNFSGQALLIAEVLNIKIEESVFKNLVNMISGGAAINFVSILSSNIQILNSSFIFNEACFGSSIFLDGIYNLTLSESNFLNNNANGVTSKKCGVGGVGLLNCLNSMQCFFEVKNNEFSNNYATVLAPNLISKSWLFVQNNTFSNNTDGSNFTQHFISFPLKIKLLSSQNITIISSGSMNSLVFYLEDYFNQSFFMGKISSAILLNDYNNSNLTLINSLTLANQSGFYNFSNLIIGKRPETYFSLEIRVRLFDFTSDENQLEVSASFLMYSRPCKIGEIHTIDDECQMCQNNYFTIFNKIYCSKCLANAYCPGGSFLIPNSGFWRYSINSQKIVKCILENSCTGGPQISTEEMFANYDNYSIQDQFIHGVCYEGHEGNLCHKCKDQYGRFSIQSLCEKCNEIQLYFTLKIVATVFVVFIYVFVSIKTLLEDQELKSSIIIGVVEKICINHVQKLSMVLTFQFNLVNINLQNYFSFLSTLSFLSESNLINECILRQLFEQVFAEDFYIYKIFFSYIVPILASVICLTGVILLEFVKKNRLQRKIFDKVYVIFLISCFLFYPMITKCSLSMVNCIPLDDTSKTFLLASPNIPCWEGFHAKAFIFVGLLGIVCWGLLFPIILGVIIGRNFRKKLKRLSKEETPPNVVIPNGINKIVYSSSMEVGDARFLFFYKDYKIQYYYWECNIFLLKFLLGLLPNITEIVGDENIDLIFVISMFFYYSMVTKLCPFKVNKLNNLEAISTIITIFSRFAIMCMNSQPDSLVFLIVFSFIFISINSFFFLLAGYYLLKYNDWKAFFSYYKEKYHGMKSMIYSLQKLTKTFRSNSQRMKRYSMTHSKSRSGGNFIKTTEIVKMDNYIQP